jgi:hypothetical protein
MFISFFFCLVKEFFKFYHVGYQWKKGNGLVVGWLYNSKKQLAHQVDQNYKPRASPSRDVLKEMMKNIENY